MKASTKVTEKYQVTIPKDIRKKIGVKVGDVLIVDAENHEIKMQRLDDFYNKYEGLLYRKGASAVKDVKMARASMYDE